MERFGFVGLPNAGKSSLFNALAGGGALAAPYPITTKHPNQGSARVPDPRLYELAEMSSSKKVIPATIEFLDIAGLVAGASQGEGLGNKFLAHIREVDAIAHVVRCFEDPDVVHVAGRVDPASDVATINTELALADLDTVERAAQRAEKAAKAMDKDAIRWRETLKRMRAWLDEGRPVRAMPLDEFDRERLRELSLLTAKQVLYVANVDEGGFSDNPRLDALEKLAGSEGSVVVAVCAAIEAEISELEEADRAAFLADLGVAEAGLDRIIRACYRLLGLLTFFTAGPKEVRAWTVHAGATAPQAAGVIHTDFERGFIRAETIAFDDYVAYKGEAGAREAGKLRLEGKEYVVREADVMHFRFNV